MNLRATLPLFTVLIFLVLVGASGWGIRHQLATPVTLESEGLLYELEPGSSLTSFAADLKALGLIESSRWLIWYGRMTGGASSLQSGEYFIERESTPLQLLALVRAGSVVQHPITFLEGWRVERWLQEIHDKSWIRRDLDGTEVADIMDRLGFAGGPAEGRFFPDTYRFPRGASDVEVLRVAAERMDAILALEWSQRDPANPLTSPYEALILASLVELESGVAADRDKIAGVFLRRLAQRLRLQSDPTVIYALGRDFSGNLTKRDLATESPYNTYQVRGLPPTPICSPGRGAIHAALHPAPGSSLFFVAKGDGTSHFSETLQEHNRAVRRYQIEGRAADYRSSPLPQDPAPLLEEVEP